MKGAKVLILFLLEIFIELDALCDEVVVPEIEDNLNQFAC